MSRVVIVDGFSSGKFVAKALRERGCTLIHVASSATLDDYYYMGFDASIYECLIVNKQLEATVERVATFDPQYIIAGAETGVLLSDWLNEQLNLPYRNQFNRTQARRNKFEMIRCVADAGLPAAQQAVVESWNAAKAWILGHGRFPVVLKPLDSAGADGVYICDDLQDCEVAFGKVLGTTNRLNIRNAQVLIQEYLVGVEYVVNMVSLGARQMVTEVVRYRKERLDSGSVIYDIDELVSPAEPECELLVDYTRKVVRSLGIENGPSHAEVMLTEKGPRLVEIAARTDGILRPEVSEQTTGLGQIRATVMSIVEPEQFERLLDAQVGYELLLHSYNVCLINRSPGCFTKELFLSELLKLESYFYSVFYVGSGQPIGMTKDVFSQPGTIYLVHADNAVIKADYLKLRALEAVGAYLAP